MLLSFFSDSLTEGESHSFCRRRAHTVRSVQRFKIHSKNIGIVTVSLAETHHQVNIVLLLYFAIFRRGHSHTPNRTHQDDKLLLFILNFKYFILY